MIPIQGIEGRGDLFKRRMYFLGLFTKMLKQSGVEAILVGGEAIDIYTAGTFSTGDIDLVVDNKVILDLNNYCRL